ncbi:MAG: PAS domain S-box protein [Ginsengibacter sp.]
MKVQRYQLVIVSIVILASAGLFYFINQNYKETTQNSVQIRKTRDILKNIDSAFYTISDLEINTQKYIITGDSSFKKETIKQTGILGEITGKLYSSTKSNSQEYPFMPLLIEKLNIHQEMIWKNKFSQKEASAIVGSTKNKNLSSLLYQSLNNSKQGQVQQINLLLSESQSFDLLNFRTSVIIFLSSISLILITLLKVYRNRRLRKLAEKDTLQIEMKYKNLVQNSGVGLLTTDLNGNITFINKRITSFTGFEPSEIIGKHFSTLVDKKWALDINDTFSKQLQSREYESNVRFPLKVKSGNIIWVEQANILLTENEEPKGFQCIVNDITEKREIEVKLKNIELQREENEFRLQSIFDNTPLIIFIKDLEGRYLLANKSFRDAFNFTRDQIIGKTDFDLVEENEAERYKEIDEYVIEKQKNVEIEETLQQGDETKNLLIVKFPLFDKNNKIYGIGGIASDITERYLYGMHLIEAKSKAEMAEQLQEQFLANMSHDIRTPMNGIIGMTNILLSTSMSDEQQDFLQVIKKSSDSLMVLINDILDLSKIKAGKLRIEKIDFRLRETLEQTIGTFRTLINDKGLKLRVSVDLNTPDSLIGDPHRLNQILNNLLSNAIKFTATGEINVEVKSLNQQNNEVELSFCIADTGIGIAPEKLQSIFESFSQAETGTSRKFGGSGLGLSISKKLVELQNGAIEACSCPGEGTTFSFTIKYVVATHTVAKQYNMMKQENFNQEGLAGKRVLVVEDNEANQKVIYHILKKTGIETDLADNGKVAIKLLEEGFEYDLIIMDLQMPEMDGFETTKYIRKHLKLSMPIIAMTASALRNEKIKCLELGMNEYLNKPFVPADLFRQLRRFLLQKEESDLQNDKHGFVYSESKKLYSLNHLIELDDLDCLCDVLRLFIESTPIIMNEIKEAIIEENWDEVYKKSHKIKSSIGILQMAKLMSLISKVESNAKERKNLEDIEAHFEEAEVLFARINPMIEAELQNALELVVKS